MKYNVLLQALGDCPKVDDCSFCPHTDHCDGLKNLCTDALNTIKQQQKQIESMKNTFYLPCKIGDTFYGLGANNIFEYECRGFKYVRYDGNIDVLMLTTVYDIDFMFGEEAFLTREEAENALRERMKGNDESI